MLEKFKYRRRAAAWITRVFVAAVLVTIPPAAMALDQNPRLNIYSTDATVGQLFKQIEAQSGYTFAYNKSALDLSRQVTLQASQADMKDVLNHILDGSGFTYILSDKHIIIMPMREYGTGQPRQRQTAQAPSSPRAQARQEVMQATLRTDSPMFLATPPPAPQYVEPAVQTPAATLPDLPVVKAEEAYVEVVDDQVYMVIPGQQVVAMGDMTPRASSISKPLALKTPNVPKSPLLALKTNLLFDATTTMNLGLELRISPKWTMELTGSYNPWSWPDNRKWKSIIVQPEFRWWLCDPFAGHFLGVHAHWAHYNFGNLPFGALKGHRYQGDLVGAGISYGYSWYLGKRWALEATVGVGYAYMWYQRFDREVCGNCYGWESKDYIGITKLGVSLSYLIK